MPKLYETGIYLLNGKTIVTDPAQLPAGTTKEEAGNQYFEFGSQPSA